MASRRVDPHPADPAEHHIGPVPPANEPGHHPELEQDKPIGRRPRPRRAPSEVYSNDRRRFPMEFAGRVGAAARIVVLREGRAYVDVGGGVLIARFGPWVVETNLANVVDAEVTGPFRWWKVAGIPHLSLSDRGLTFATNDRRGVCVRFREPVPGIEVTGRVRHPGLTVTVADPEGLVAALS